MAFCIFEIMAMLGFREAEMTSKNHLLIDHMGLPVSIPE